MKKLRNVWALLVILALMVGSASAVDVDEQQSAAAYLNIRL